MNLQKIISEIKDKKIIKILNVYKDEINSEVCGNCKFWHDIDEESGYCEFGVNDSSTEIKGNVTNFYFSCNLYVKNI